MTKPIDYLFTFYPNSGPGSHIEYTRPLIQRLPALFKQLNIKSVFDAPCGDLVWMSQVLDQCPDIQYVGGDIDDRFISSHKERYGGNVDLSRQFQYFNIITDPLPKADIWIARDIWFHFSIEHINACIRNFINSDIRYILTTTYGFDTNGYSGNTGRGTGAFFLLNLFDDPFNFPTPLVRFNDTYQGFDKREMCVWSRGQLEQLYANKPLLTDSNIPKSLPIINIDTTNSWPEK